MTLDREATSRRSSTIVTNASCKPIVPLDIVVAEVTDEFFPLGAPELEVALERQRVSEA